MSLNVSGNKYVTVYDPTIKLNYSDKVIFAKLVTSRKTDEAKMDKETGEILTDENGKQIMRREYSKWEARFAGSAFEAAKGLHNNDKIDIINGWIVNEPYTGKDKKEHYCSYIVITEFIPSYVAEGEDEDATESTAGEI